MPGWLLSTPPFWLMLLVFAAEVAFVFVAVADMTSDGVLESKIMLDPTLVSVGAIVLVVKAIDVVESVAEDEESSDCVDVVVGACVVVVVFDGVGGVAVICEVEGNGAAVVVVLAAAVEDELLPELGQRALVAVPARTAAMIFCPPTPAHAFDTDAVRELRALIHVCEHVPDWKSVG